MPPPVASVPVPVWDTPAELPFSSSMRSLPAMSFSQGLVDGAAGLAAFAAFDVYPVSDVLVQPYLPIMSGVGTAQCV